MSIANLVRATSTTVSHLRDIRRQAPPIVFLNQRWAHHGRHSGYLVDVGVGPSIPRLDRFVPDPVRQWWSKRTGDYLWEDRWVLWMNLAASGAQVLHLIDGDFDTWAYLHRPPFLKTAITGTFHQTIDRLPGIVAQIAPGALSGIVCVSRNQIPFLAPLVPEGRCVFIPHGVDTEFFTPPAAVPTEGGSASAPALVLSVGAHRRDFPTLLAAARLIRARRPEVVVKLIAAAEKVQWIVANGGDAVEVRSGVSDQDLLEEYRRASVVLSAARGGDREQRAPGGDGLRGADGGDQSAGDAGLRRRGLRDLLPPRGRGGPRRRRPGAARRSDPPGSDGPGGTRPGADDVLARGPRTGRHVPGRASPQAGARSNRRRGSRSRADSRRDTGVDSRVGSRPDSLADSRRRAPSAAAPSAAPRR